MPAEAGPLLFNPALLPRDDLVASFLIRHEQLESLLDLIRGAAEGEAPQHALVLGWRGMGKTTLLHRLAYAIADDPALAKRWQPVLYDEEQYNIGELADFWLNTLEMLGTAVDRPAQSELANSLAVNHRGRELEEAAFAAVKEEAKRLDRRLILLVDNVDGVLNRIDDDVEASRLREILQQEPWLLLIGASSRAIEATYDYRQPFYQLFRVFELDPLDEEETLSLLDGLAQRFDAPEVARLLERDRKRLGKLQLLMGGNPRTVALLFGVLQEDPNGNLRSYLERLLDEHTSLYKDRIEALPRQAQRVFDALARRWNPATAADIAGDLRLERGPVSAQLHRMVDQGLVEKVDVPGRAIGFQIRERFFNIWCLMRLGRRCRQRLRRFLEFMEIFYGRDVELPRRVLAPQWEPVTHALALASGRDPERLARLAPEVRAVTEDVLERMEELREEKAAAATG